MKLKQMDGARWLYVRVEPQLFPRDLKWWGNRYKAAIETAIQRFR